MDGEEGDDEVRGKEMWKRRVEQEQLYEDEERGENWRRIRRKNWRRKENKVVGDDYDDAADNDDDDDDDRIQVKSVQKLWLLRFLIVRSYDLSFSHLSL
jgi:hypothetical protein